MHYRHASCRKLSRQIASKLTSAIDSRRNMAVSYLFYVVLLMLHLDMVGMLHWMDELEYRRI